MPITTIVPHKDGGAWGWDDSANSWVPVDTNALGGNPIANLGRGAMLGGQEVYQGARELLGEPGDPSIAAAGQVLQQQKTAAQNAAPWTMALGMGAPELAAGAGAAYLTGGTSLPALIGGQILAGGGVGALRPGDAGQRVQNAAIGALFAGGGAALGEVATRGIAAGLAIGRGVTEGSVESTAQGVINGIARQQNAEARATLAQGAGAADGNAGALSQGVPEGVAGSNQAGSVGAATTPEAALDPLTAMENRALSEADRTAAENISRGSTQQIIERGRRVGIEPAWWAESEKGSLARLTGAVNEFNPFQEAGEAARIEKNQMVLNRAAAKATGEALTMDPVENTHTRIDQIVLARMRDHLDMGQEALKGELPRMQVGDMRKALEEVDVARGTTNAGEMFDELRKTMMGNMTKLGDHANLDPNNFINDTRNISRLVAKAAAEGDAASQEAFIELNNKLYDLAEKTTKAARKDQTITGKGWAELRREEQMYMTLSRAGVVDGQGNINPRSLLNHMRKQKSKGGFGVHGPDEKWAQRDLWDAALAELQNQTNVPPTGARLVGALGGLARGTARSKLTQTGVGGALGVGAYNSIWK